MILMRLSKLIQSISKDIEIIDSFTKESFYGVDIDYVAFKIGSHYFLVSKSTFYVLTEQTPDSSMDITPPVAYSRSGLIKEIKRLEAIYGN